MAKVYLDHHMLRDNFRYIEERKVDDDQSSADRESGQILLRDIARDDWFRRLRKPDFQRETNKWTPEACADLLGSLFRGDVIPAVIVWQPSDSVYIYVIDGAHRLSVIRAWMKDDWGDRELANHHLDQRDEIIASAHEVRQLVREQVGSFDEFVRADETLLVLTDQNKPWRSEMADREYRQARFYGRLQRNATLFTQWISGTYEQAENSFLRINRGGERLSRFEQIIIEHRNGPYARVVSSIVSAGKPGHFWPKANLDDDLTPVVLALHNSAVAAHKVLFDPPHKGPPVDLNQPLVVSKPGERIEDCLNLIALVVDNALLDDEAEQDDILKKNASSDAREVVLMGKRVFQLLLDRLSQLVGENVSSASLCIIPLVYFYNHQGVYSKNLLYGFLYWMFSGEESEVLLKKIAFSAVRGQFEQILLRCKKSITALSRKGGGFKTTGPIASLLADIVQELLKAGDVTETDAINGVIAKLGLSEIEPTVSLTRSATLQQRSQINIETLLGSSPKCSICGGYLNLRIGKQYDHHFTPWAQIRNTSTDNLKATHPFCNNQKDAIQKFQATSVTQSVPRIPSSQQNVRSDKRQLTLDF